ncbi:MAG: substrate-binding domain-containing protein [Candidatus Bathyarchaeota archaeon]|nr:substrate-binding domain-containing protein [Candidatus Bathyarchaeota archaeon]
MSASFQLHVFSAGAVAPPMQEAIAAFERKTGTVIRLTAGKPENLLKSIALRKQGDILTSGAEYVHDEAEDMGLLIKGTRRSLGYRRSVLLTQEGNPKGIKRLEDLCEPGMRVGTATGGCLKGVWDDVCSKAGLIERIRPNIVEHADACGSLMALIHQDKVDAIFGWNAFKNIWPDTCEVVEMPRELQIFRSTAAQVVTYTKDLELSKRFIEFLVSPEGRRIYSENGWLHEPVSA